MLCTCFDDVITRIVTYEVLLSSLSVCLGFFSESCVGVQSFAVCDYYSIDYNV